MGLSADPQERTGRNAERVPAIAQGCQAGVLEPWCPTALGRLSDQSGLGAQQSHNLSAENHRAPVSGNAKCEHSSGEPIDENPQRSH